MELFLLDFDDDTIVSDDEDAGEYRRCCMSFKVWLSNITSSISSIGIEAMLGNSRAVGLLEFCFKIPRLGTAERGGIIEDISFPLFTIWSLLFPLCRWKWEVIGETFNTAADRAGPTSKSFAW